MNKQRLYDFAYGLYLTACAALMAVIIIGALTGCGGGGSGGEDYVVHSTRLKASQQMLVLPLSLAGTAERPPLVARWNANVAEIAAFNLGPLCPTGKGHPGDGIAACHAEWVQLTTPLTN